MRILAAIGIALATLQIVAASDRGFPANCSERLRQIDARLMEIGTEMQALPVMSDIDARGTHGFHSDFTPESGQHWFEIRWNEPKSIDGIGMIPTRITTQSGLRSNYGFPSSMRIEATRKGEEKPYVLAEIPETRLDIRRGEPLFIDVKAEGVTSLRFIPINLPTLPGKDVRFFSLAEVMVYQGQRNVARGAKLRASYSINGEEGWNIRYLTDEKSSLGPPEMAEPGKSLGWHSRFSRIPAWAVIDLGASREFESIRLFAARGDAPIKGPGFGFPVKFRFDVADEGPDGPWKTIWSSGKKNVGNPGYNPVTLRFPPARGRYVRAFIEELHAPDEMTLPRVLLSEMEVLHNFQNLALNCPVSTPDGYEVKPHDATRVWSSAGLTDGYTSSGRIIPEREWISSLSRRFDLVCEKTQLESEQTLLLAYWHRLFLIVSFGLLATVIIGLLIWLIRQRLSTRRTMLALRRSISSDLHDEVGSNLATISLLSELADSRENLDDINRLSRETSLALREIVEINLSSKRVRKPLPERLREITSLMLRDHQWTFNATVSPVFDLEQRKHLVFFFKESLHNIIRHAKAGTVRITFDKVAPNFRLHIEDDGKGIPDGGAGGLFTLRQRAQSLDGTFEVDSSPGMGTRLTLLFPISFRK